MGALLELRAANSLDLNPGRQEMAIYRRFIPVSKTRFPVGMCHTFCVSQRRQ